MKTIYKSGFIAVMGKPNVGKSTLVNTLIGQKIAAVTPRPQTTRKRQMGILTLENAQLVFIDTPGVHNPRHKLGENMNQEALDSLENCDLVLFVVDVSQKVDDEDRLLANELSKLRVSIPIILVLNKSDLVKDDRLKENEEASVDLLPSAIPMVVSATRGDGIDFLREEILEHLKPGEPFFPEDQVTDIYERDIAADLLRESALIYLRDEVPHGIAVRIDQYIERKESGAYIEATLFVEKESHKPIVIGQNGEMLKKIGAAARQEIEKVTSRKVYLRIRVKVRKNWRDDDKVLKSFGF
jgi:GTP-binding protein Era